MMRRFVERLPRMRIPSISLRRVLPEAQFVGCSDWAITGCSIDHHRLEPGQLFVATTNAHGFVREALHRGAAGVIVERYCPEAGRLQAVVPDAMAAHARICQALAGNPAQQLLTLGVTGGFGKTLTALMIQSIIDAAGDRCGLIGSLGFCDGATTRSLGAGFDLRKNRCVAGTDSQGGRVTGNRRDVGLHLSIPAAARLAALLVEMVELGCRATVLEASCDAIAQRGFEGIAFHGAVVTDLATSAGFPDDVVQRRRGATARFIRQVAPGGVAVVNANEVDAETLCGVNLDARRVVFALRSGRSRKRAVDVSGQIVRIDNSGTRLLLSGFDRQAAVHLPLVGLRVASCAAAAAALAWALDIDSAPIVSGLEAVESVAGHLEKVDEGQDFAVRIDAAQTPEALHEALAALRAIVAGRVHCVVSAEGGSDPIAQRRLAEVAEIAADSVIITVSNPRTKDPDKLLEDLLAGFQSPSSVRIEPDRRSAIHMALASAQTGDGVLIAGKGHNCYQILANRVVAFHDDVVVRQWLRSQLTAMARRLA
jgi:UDP-N-acetylmuramoyl-L-alanyl-D-glutamate--2,6-diaminopimelate ligase